MSIAQVDKPTTITQCDYCGKEISDDDMSQWAHIVRGFISRPTKEARYLKFLWIKDKRYVRHAPGNEVEYDFHASCFDEMVKTAKSLHSTNNSLEEK